MASITLFLAGKKVGTHEMKSTPFVVGREKDCGLCIENVGVSRRHCQFLYEDGSYWVEDVGSSNGTYHKGSKLSGRLRIADGDELNIGKYVLLFEDKGLEMLPAAGGEQQPAAAGAGPPLGDGGMTFQMDPQTLRQQMAKAGAAAAPAAQAQRAADVASQFDPDAPLTIKGKERGRSVFATVFKLLGLSIAAAAILLGLLYALRGG
jgi:predicted component of type VI protein secretion system